MHCYFQARREEAEKQAVQAPESYGQPLPQNPYAAPIHPINPNFYIPQQQIYADPNFLFQQQYQGYLPQMAQPDPSTPVVLPPTSTSNDDDYDA